METVDLKRVLGQVVDNCYGILIWCITIALVIGCKSQISKEGVRDNNGVIYGSIYTKKDSTLLTFGKVFVPRLLDTAIVDSNGLYKFELPVGRHEIVGTSLGHDQQVHRISISSNDSIRLDIYVDEKEEWLHQ
ncbi:MAG: hypothetical protein AAGH46_13850 [Bacteroidota bacterium]